MKSIEGIRQEIDSIDREIASLLSKRLDLCMAMGELKREKSERVLQPNRENEVLANVCAQTDHKEEIEDIYHRIIEVCRRIQL